MLGEGFEQGVVLLGVLLFFGLELSGFSFGLALGVALLDDGLDSQGVGAFVGQTPPQFFGGYFAGFASRLAVVTDFSNVFDGSF